MTNNNFRIDSVGDKTHGVMDYVPYYPTQLSYTFPEPVGEGNGLNDMEIIFNAMSNLCEIVTEAKKALGETE